ncbi:MAG: RAD55 family ATPase [Thermoplasmata archaeon]
MASRAQGGSGPEPRISIGVPALDTILAGGLMPHRPYLIVGPSGTGKTTLALQFLCEGVRRGERCLLVTLEEPPNEMRVNHRGLSPELDDVYVFDAIPDVMRYERAPFKDIAAVREAIPFGQIPLAIRKTPELSSVEVTFTALEQTLKMEMARRNYRRIVVDSLTALQYFCMKGVDETVGAQTFLRFLSDLKVTTLLTVESPLEDVESPERLLARGEIRLFRWELEGRTVRAIGVEKLRGSPHDIRLHPYRIHPGGLDVNLDVTISRDSRRIVEAPGPGRPPGATVEGIPPILENLSELEQQIHDLIEVGLNFPALREAVGDVAQVAGTRPSGEAMHEYQRLRALVHDRIEQFRLTYATRPPSEPPSLALAARRLLGQAAEARAGIPPILPLQLPAIAGRLRLLHDTIPLAAELPRPVPTSSAPSGPPPVVRAEAPAPPPLAPTPAQAPLSPPPPPPRNGPSPAPPAAPSAPSFSAVPRSPSPPSQRATVPAPPASLPPPPSEAAAVPPPSRTSQDVSGRPPPMRPKDPEPPSGPIRSPARVSPSIAAPASPPVPTGAIERPSAATPPPLPAPSTADPVRPEVVAPVARADPPSPPPGTPTSSDDVRNIRSPALPGTEGDESRPSLPQVVPPSLDIDRVESTEAPAAGGHVAILPREGPATPAPPAAAKRRRRTPATPAKHKRGPAPGAPPPAASPAVVPAPGAVPTTEVSSGRLTPPAMADGVTPAERSKRRTLRRRKPTTEDGESPGADGAPGTPPPTDRGVSPEHGDAPPLDDDAGPRKEAST